MSLYTVAQAILAIVLGICIAVGAKKGENVVYGKLDRAGRVTNLLLLILYGCLSPFYLFLGMLSRPAYSGFLGVLGWVVSLLVASALLLCGLGLGLSVALRKKGKSKQSFAVQFLGVAGMGLSFLLFLCFYGNLLRSLN